MPRAAQASMICGNGQSCPRCLRTVAVLIESQRWSWLKSRMPVATSSPLDTVQRQQRPHAPHGELGLFEQAGRIGEPEQLGKVRQRAGALLSTDHDEMVLVAVEPGHEHHAGLVETRRRLEDVARERYR